MRYSMEALTALEQEVESQGGAVLPDECRPQDIEYKKKDGYEKTKTVRNATCGCMNETRMVSVYDPGEETQGGSGFCTSCAVCDSMGNWPRFAGAVHEADPELEQADDDEDEDEDA